MTGITAEVPPLSFKLLAFQDRVRAGRVRLTVDGRLQLSAASMTGYFQINDPAALVQWPQSNASPKRADDLWKKTCCEIFLKQPTERRYWEYNFSPEGSWNCYRHADYRQDSRWEEGVTSSAIQFHRDALRLEFTAPLPSPLHDRMLHIGVACVLLTEEGLLHFALQHGPEKPDFHRHEYFNLVWQGTSK